jgi:hypothetical protein
LSSKLKVAFDAPHGGWMGLTIRADTRAIALQMSYTPFDSLDEIVGALHGLTTYDDRRSVRISEEPEVCELRFERNNGTMDLEVCRRGSFQHRRRQMLLKTRGSTLEMCLPFWRALRSLQTGFSEKEFEFHWRRPFPTSEMDRLTTHLKQLREQ